MRIVLVIPPVSFVNYPINEAGLYARYLRISGHEVHLLEWHLDFYARFEKEEAPHLLESLGHSVSETVFLKTTSDIFETDHNADWLLRRLISDEDFAQDCIRQVLGLDPDVVCYVMQYMRTIPRILRWIQPVARSVRERGARCRHILVGHGVRELPTWARDFVVQEPGIDQVHLGEEWDLPAFLVDSNAVANPDAFASVDVPDLSLYRLHDYLNWRIGTRVVNIYGSRGCPGKCVFCHERLVHAGYRERTPASIAHEVSTLHLEHRISIFRFSDCLVNATPARLLSLAAELTPVHKQHGVVWAGMLRPSHSISLDDAARLYESGCRALWSGVEHGSQVVIDDLQKNVRVSLLPEIAKNLRRAGITFVTFWIVGAPWDSPERAKTTAQAIARCSESGAGIYYFPFRYYCNATMSSDIRAAVTIDDPLPLDNQYEFRLKVSDTRPYLESVRLALVPHVAEPFLYEIEGLPLVSEL